VVVAVGSYQFTINGEYSNMHLPEPVKIVNSRMMVPIGSLITALGTHTVKWDGAASVAHFTSRTRVYIDGLQLQIADQAPFLEDGTLFVPVGAFFMAIGATVSPGDNDGEAAIIMPDGRVVVIAIGSQQFTVNGEYSDIHLPEPVRIVNSRMVVPIGNLIRVLETHDIQWDGAAGVAHFTSRVSDEYDDGALLVDTQDDQVLESEQWVYGVMKLIIFGGTTIVIMLLGGLMHFLAWALKIKQQTPDEVNQ